MCGIAGFLGMDDQPLLRRMTDIISHRGPDDSGTFSEDLTGLGHRRLSIIDLSKKGQQPMEDDAKRAVITYNGEIYNFSTIRDELLELGYSFSSNTDTEVLLNAYLEWGEGCLGRLNGMFAFAIWDRKKKMLFAARDRLGIKPLFYTVKNNILLFSSEIKSILCWNRIKREVNTRALDYFFTFRYNHLNETLFKDIYKLPPGHSMTARLDSRGSLDISVDQYWDASLENPDASGDIAGELAERIKESVSLRMMSDVPLGSFLSSGVDSSTIAAVMRKELNDPAHTFTVGFDYPGFEDELDPVRFTSGHLGTDHTEYICRPDMISILPRIVWHAEELNADPALIPTFLISEIAAKKVKVALSGEGSDELFGGYERTMLMKHVWGASQKAPALISLIPKLAGLMPDTILDRVFKYSSMIGSRGISRLSDFCSNINDIGKSYLDVACVFNQKEKALLYGEKMREQLLNEDIAESINNEFFGSGIKDKDELVRRLSYFELKTRLPNDLLAKTDTMTMAHSLEARVPYLDHNLVEYAFSIPSGLKIKRMRDKYILRQAVRRYLPERVVKRRKDHFFVPIHLWLQNELKETADRVLSRENIERTGYLNPDFITHAYDNYKKGSLFYARQIWNILFFLTWHKLFIEGDRFLTMSESPEDLSALFKEN